jgi:hypothetical protein
MRGRVEFKGVMNGVMFILVQCRSLVFCSAFGEGIPSHVSSANVKTFQIPLTKRKASIFNFDNFNMFNPVVFAPFKITVIIQSVVS